MIAVRKLTSNERRFLDQAKNVTIQDLKHFALDLEEGNPFYEAVYAQTLMRLQILDNIKSRARSIMRVKHFEAWLILFEILLQLGEDDLAESTSDRIFKTFLLQREDKQRVDSIYRQAGYQVPKKLESNVNGQDDPEEAENEEDGEEEEEEDGPMNLEGAAPPGEPEVSHATHLELQRVVLYFQCFISSITMLLIACIIFLLYQVLKTVKNINV